MIVKQLIKLQQGKNLTDNEFATTLGIHRQSWLGIKRRGLIGPETLLSAIRVYPELKEELLSAFTNRLAGAGSEHTEPQNFNEVRSSD